MAVQEGRVCMKHMPMTGVCGEMCLPQPHIQSSDDVLWLIQAAKCVVPSWGWWGTHASPQAGKMAAADQTVQACCTGSQRKPLAGRGGGKILKI